MYKSRMPSVSCAIHVYLILRVPFAATGFLLCVVSGSPRRGMCFSSLKIGIALYCDTSFHHEDKQFTLHR